MEKISCYKIIQAVESGEKVSLSLKEYAFVVSFLVNHVSESVLISRTSGNKVELYMEKENEDGDYNI